MNNKDFKILIVDDVPTNIQVLGNILRNENYQVAFASNGKEAINLVESYELDIILLDVMMPEMDGFEVCQILKNNPKHSDIPIIFLTAKVEKENIIRGFELGAQDYVTKPFNPQELLARVHTQLLLVHQKRELTEMNTYLEEKVIERTEQLKDAHEKLSILEKTKSDFLNIISHELRTPLNGIVGYTEYLMDSLNETQYAEYIKVVKEGSDRLIKFSDTALLINSLKVESYNLTIKSCFVKVLVNRAIDQYRKEMANNEISVNLNLESTELKFNVDKDLIQRCFENIVENAINHSNKNTHITVNSRIEDNQLIVEFADQGIGFEKEIMNKFFDFFASGDVMKRQGLGLGLVTCKLIMDAHRGKIEILNGEISGAIVRLYFPQD